jgi:hypothetical protein
MSGYLTLGDTMGQDTKRTKRNKFHVRKNIKKNGIKVAPKKLGAKPNIRVKFGNEKSLLIAILENK